MSIKSIFFAGLLAASAMAAPLARSASTPITITMPSAGLAECAPATFEWLDQAIEYPLYLRIHTAVDSTGALQAEDEEALITLADRATWMVDYPAGTNVKISVRDAAGRTGLTDMMTITQGTTTSCMAEDDELLFEQEQQQQVYSA